MPNQQRLQSSAGGFQRTTRGGDRPPRQRTRIDSAGGSPDIHQMSGELMDAKIAAAEARTDVKFAQLLSRIDALGADIRGDLTTVRTELGTVKTEVGNLKADNKSTRGTVRNTGLAIIGIILALAALIPSVFDLGEKMRQNARDSAIEAVNEQRSSVD